MSKKIIQPVVLTIITGGLLLFFYPSSSELGESFVVVSIYMMLQQIIVIGGIVLFILSIVVARNISLSVIFIYVSVLNLAVCMSATILFILHEATRAWLHQCLLNGLMGMAMIVLLLFRSKSTKTNP